MRRFEIGPFQNSGSIYDVMDSFLTPLKNDFKVDIQENENEYIVEADLPGYKKEDVSASLRNHYLEIVATKNEEKEENNDYVYKERSTSTVKRKFYLNAATNEKVSAKLEEGVLKLVIPKDKNVADGSKIEIE